MRKYVSYIIITLSIALMFLLSGCKQSRAFEIKTDSVSVQSLHVEDSLRSDFSFIFDRLDMWFLDSMDVDSLKPLSALWAYLSPKASQSERYPPRGRIHPDGYAASSPPRGRLGGGLHVAIQGGHISNSKTENHIKQVVDSATMKSQEVIHPVNVPPKIPAGFVIGVLVIITFVIYASRTHN